MAKKMILFVFTFLNAIMLSLLITFTSVKADPTTPTLSQIQYPITDINSSGSPISITDKDTQNFFTSFDDATVQPNDDGTWSTVNLTPMLNNQRGSVTLNMGIDMTKGFNFQWEIKIKPAASVADGIGFALHPTYDSGTQPILDSRTGHSFTLPTNFSGQGLSSLGHHGGNLGISDLMNVMGFKIDTYYNNSGIKQNDSYYYDTAPGDYFQDDPKLNNNAWVPYATFFNTDHSGWGYASTNGTSAQSVDDTSGSANAVNVLNNQWWLMKMSYTPYISNNQPGTLTVFLTNPDNPAQSLNWSRNITTYEQDNIDTHPFWAFCILASTGGSKEDATIQAIQGNFTPERSIITRYTDENGKNLRDISTMPITQWYKQHKLDSNPLTFTGRNLDYITTDQLGSGALFWRFQLNATTYDTTGASKTRRLIATNDNSNTTTGDTFTTTGDTWNISWPFSNSASVSFLTYVYRRYDDGGGSNLTASLTARKNGSSSSSDTTLTVSPGDKIDFTYSVTQHNKYPYSLVGVKAVQVLPPTLTYDSSLNPLAAAQGTTVVHNQTGDPVLEVALRNSTDTNDNLLANNTVTKTVTLIYTGITRGQINIASNGNITIVPTVKSTDISLQYYTPYTLTTKTRFYVYDQSPQLIDGNGAPVLGSYYYSVVTGTSAPLATSSTNYSSYATDNDLANFIPGKTSDVSLNNTPLQGTTQFSYWDLDSGTSMDPTASSGNPTSNINNFNAGNNTLTNTLETPLKENLPRGTPLVDGTKFTGNENYAPAPYFSGYQYLGYYAYDGNANSAIWNPYNATSKANTSYTGKYLVPTVWSGDTVDKNQQVAFIYR